MWPFAIWSEAAYTASNHHSPTHIPCSRYQTAHGSQRHPHRLYTFSFAALSTSWISIHPLSPCFNATSFFLCGTPSPLLPPVSVGNNLLRADTDFAYCVVIPFTTLKSNCSVHLPVCPTSLWMSRSQGLHLTHFVYYSLNEDVVDILNKKSIQKVTSKLYSLFSFYVMIFKGKVLLIRCFNCPFLKLVCICLNFHLHFKRFYIWFMYSLFIMENYPKSTDKYKKISI